MQVSESKELIGDSFMTVLGESAILTEIKQDEKLATRPTLTEDDKLSMEWIPWGDADDYPNRLDEDFRRVGVLQTAIDVNANIHYGQGVEWYKKVVEGGKRTLQIQEIQEYDDWASDTKFNVELGSAIYSLEYLNIAFFEFVLNNIKRDIVSVQNLDTMSCRFAKRQTDGSIKNIYFNSNFGKENGIKTKDCEDIALYNPKVEITKQAQKFVLPVFYKTLGNNFYPEPNIQALVANGWMENAKSVPKYINAIYKNQISPKFNITVPLMLLIEFAGVDEAGWRGLDSTKRLEYKTKLKTWIDDQLSREENAGKSIVTFSLFESNSQHKVEITAIESGQNSTKELPNGYAANQEILFATNTDPELIGLGVPGGKNLSGSGSGKREALLLAQSLKKRERTVSLQIPELVAKIKRLSGFPSGVFPTYVDLDISQTLDKNPTGKETKVN